MLQIIRLKSTFFLWLTAASLGSLAALSLTDAAADQPPTVADGLYMERAADCMACHTRPGGTPFAGGREIGTPFGKLSSPNITPDSDTGIGAWSDEQFYRALHDGIGHRGDYLYPVMPFTSYTKMTRSDVLAIKTYLFALKPVFSPRPPNGLYFPFDIRSTLFVWRELFFRAGTFVPNPKHSPEWNRGAYLVEGPGHCGECHSPRNLLGATESSESLSGGMVQRWLAPNISSDPLDGIGSKTVAEIAIFLRHGADKSMGVAFGPMSEVVHDSLRYMTEADIHDIAVFLKEGPERMAPAPESEATKRQLRVGRKLYLENCAQCHQDNGSGIAGAVPNLAGNAALSADRPNDIIDAILSGLQGTGNYGQMPSFAGAFSDQSIADIVNYIRSSWVNKSPTDATPALVASLRAKTNVGAAGTEAARDFDCPKVGSAIVPQALATPAQVALLANSGGADIENQIMVLIDSTRSAQPGISDTNLVNTLNAAYCPVVANISGLSAAEKRARLWSFASRVEEIVSENPAPGGASPN